MCCSSTILAQLFTLLLTFGFVYSLLVTWWHIRRFRNQYSNTVFGASSISSEPWPLGFVLFPIVKRSSYNGHLYIKTCAHRYFFSVLLRQLALSVAGCFTSHMTPHVQLTWIHCPFLSASGYSGSPIPYRQRSASLLKGGYLEKALATEVEWLWIFATNSYRLQEKRLVTSTALAYPAGKRHRTPESRTLLAYCFI